MTKLLRKVETSHCATEMDGELVMIHVDTGKFFSLKGVGLDIWQRLDGETDLDALCADLCRDYGITAEECSKSVEAFVSQLTAAGFAELA
ncbi:MAG: PqqD family protein [Novosphingobium sp.]